MKRFKPLGTSRGKMPAATKVQSTKHGKRGYNRDRDRQTLRRESAGR